MYTRGFLASFAILFLLCQPAMAATLYIDPPQKTLGRGDAEIFKVRIDTDEAIGECVNAISGVVQFSGPLEPIDISTGSSILNIWLEPPTVVVQNSQVTFTGGIPNGYCGRIDGDPNLTNTLFEIIARADVNNGDTEVATIAFTNETTAYLNDGLGTRASLDLLSSTITINPTANELVADPWTEKIVTDTTPPQEFSILLERDRLAFRGRYYISFSTTDKQTGIDSYEVMEEPISQAGSFSWGRADAPWVKAVSPYVLDDQSLNSVIRVKAIDKAGNEYIATIIPDEELRSVSVDQMFTYALYGFTALVLLGLAFGVSLYVRHLRRVHIEKMFDELTQSAVSNDKQDPEQLESDELESGDEIDDTYAKKYESNQ